MDMPTLQAIFMRKATEVLLDKAFTAVDYNMILPQHML